MTKTRYYDKVKHPRQITLDGVDVKLEIVAGDIRGITLTGKNGGELVVRKGIYSDIEVLVPGEAPKKGAFRLHGSFAQMPVDIIYRDKYTAETKMGNLTIKDPDAVLELVEVQIPEEDYDAIKDQ